MLVAIDICHVAPVTLDLTLAAGQGQPERYGGPALGQAAFGNFVQPADAGPRLRQ